MKALSENSTYEHKLSACLEEYSWRYEGSKFGGRRHVVGAHVPDGPSETTVANSGEGTALTWKQLAL